MNNAINLLDKWFKSVDLKDRSLKDVHVDAFFQETDKKLLMQKSISLFKNLCKRLQQDIHKESYIPALVFSLECSAKLMTTVIDSFWDEFDITPPSLYLIPIEHMQKGERVEEYKNFLPMDSFNEFNDDYIIYYRCFRNIQDQRNNWEYTRAVYVFKYGINNII